MWPLCLTCFTQGNVYKVHPRGSMKCSAIPFHGCVVFLDTDGHIVFIHSSGDGHSGCFHLVVIVTSAAMDICI